MLSSLRKSRKPGWMAIQLHGASVTLAHVVRTRDARPEVRLLESFALENGEREALQRLRARRDLRSYACTALMPDGEYAVTQLDAPPVPAEERKEALRWSLKEVVPYAVDTACIGVLDIPGRGQSSGPASTVLVVSASESAVLARVKPFEEAKVTLGAVDIPELAQRNVAVLLEEENRGLVFLRVDDVGTMLTLTFNGELVAVRRSDMTSVQLSAVDAEQRERVRERLVLEVQRSLDNFDRQYSHIPVSRVVLASYPRVEGLAAALAENVYVPIQEMDLSSVMDFRSTPELTDLQYQAKHLLAIGAALRTSEGNA
ncbi:type IV pilus biogenesis protein PilM [Propionivibrio soli]|uniref:type IV pilus biogenesis protein PilM n=1 Tax=Propionivibrio soli TaxID=2976531 RepID=UPI0021E7A94B|nr:hypothetical protein [Propionivibrio soli]